MKLLYRIVHDRHRLKRNGKTLVNRNEEQLSRHLSSLYSGLRELALSLQRRQTLSLHSYTFDRGQPYSNWRLSVIFVRHEFELSVISQQLSGHFHSSCLIYDFMEVYFETIRHHSGATSKVEYLFCCVMVACQGLIQVFLHYLLELCQFRSIVIYFFYLQDVPMITFIFSVMVQMNTLYDQLVMRCFFYALSFESSYKLETLYPVNSCLIYQSYPTSFVLMRPSITTQYEMFILVSSLHVFHHFLTLNSRNYRDRHPLSSFQAF